MRTDRHHFYIGCTFCACTLWCERKIMLRNRIDKIIVVWLFCYFKVYELMRLRCVEWSIVEWV
jgi:hypothetical protein